MSSDPKKPELQFDRNRNWYSLKQSFRSRVILKNAACKPFFDAPPSADKADEVRDDNILYMHIVAFCPPDILQELSSQ